MRRFWGRAAADGKSASMPSTRFQRVYWRRAVTPSRYAIDPEAIPAGRLPDKASVVTSMANSHYQKHFDRLFAFAKAGDWGCGARLQGHRQQLNLTCSYV